MRVAPGTTSKSIDVYIDNGSGAGVTGLVAATWPTTYYSLGDNTAKTAITLSDLASITAAYSSGGVFERGAGWYRLDAPNAMLATADRTATIFSTDAAKVVLAPPIEVGRPEVNTTHLAGTAQTGRDIGASVLLSSGTGTGQLDFTSGVVKSNLAQILGTVLTETAGQIAAAFKKFFNVAAPTGTVNSLPDAVAGAAGGVSIVGSAMALTSAERTTLAAAIEAAMIDDGDATALLEAIADKIADENVTAEVLGTSIRDAILDRVLSGNHDIAGSTGKLIQEATASTFLNSLFTSGLTISNTTKELFQHLAAMYLDYKRRTDGLSDQEKLDVNAEADTALSDYAPQTAAQATTDKQAVLDAIEGIDGGSDGDPSGTAKTLTFTDASSNYIADAEVWVTSDADGDTKVAGPKRTDSHGRVTFSLILGNQYYVWLRKDGVNPILGRSYVPAADD
jgi:hypothetical protein